MVHNQNRLAERLPKCRPWRFFKMYPEKGITIHRSLQSTFLHAFKLEAACKAIAFDSQDCPHSQNSKKTINCMI